MKQQEILKKIGNILKELNEQYDYLQAEEAHTNDLELELFAANAKFLTDHTEILRKINTQNQNTRLTLPEHTDTALEEQQAAAENDTSITTVSDEERPIDDFKLPALAERAITYQPTAEPVTEPEFEPIETQTETSQEYIHPIAEEEAHEPEISIEPASSYDKYDYIRQESQVSNDHHNFSISSHSEEEEKPPHVDLTSVNEEPAEPAQVYHPVAETEIITDTDKTAEEPVPYTNEVHTPEVIELLEQAPIEADAKPVADSEPVGRAYTFTEEIQVPQPNTYEQVTSNYAAPVADEAPKPELEQPLTLNERLSAQLRPNTAASPAQHNQTQATITDIKSAISLNDKMLYVKDLFNGYSLAYSEAIELLNRCKSFDEADRFLKSNYVAKNQWADKPTTVDKFYAVLHRRFTV